MKKIVSVLVLILCLSFLLIPSLKALTGEVNSTIGLNVRATPSTSSSVIGGLVYKQTVIVLATTTSTNSGCDSNTWYKITYNTTTGYVCSSYITLNSSSEEVSTEEVPVDIQAKYEEELKKFPSDYQAKIKELHNVYPNAIFVKMQTGLNWNTFLSLEYDGYYKGWSLIWDSNGSYDGYKSTDSWSYSYYTNVFNQNFTGGGANWYAASKQTIAYYLDPRNFLNQQNIFMFEALSYNKALHTKEGVEKILAGSFMGSAKIGGADNKTFADAFMDAAVKTGISPYFLASRVIQEIGTTRSTMVSGTYAGYEGYYNFYNIKATGTTVEAIIKGGLGHAKSQGWNSEYKALVNGASFVGNDYISQGQDTLYLQKWDVFGPNYARHQYMQNIQAPTTESVKTYNAYKDMGTLNGHFVFSIPVFDAMPTSTNLPNPHNPNNYLKSLTVNGTNVEKFDGNKTDYTINLSPLMHSVEIAATKVYSGSTVTGTGTIPLNGLSQDIIVKVTAKNGDVKDYKITVTRNADIPIAISEILNTMRINSDGTYISSIKLGTTVEDFTNHLKSVSTTADVVVINNRGVVKTTGVLATGDQVKITSGEVTQIFTVVIYGDINGDGLIKATDYVLIKNHILGTQKLSGAYKEAADINKDSLIKANDYVLVKNHILGTYNIVQ